MDTAGSSLLRGSEHDIATDREQIRRARVIRLALVVLVVESYVIFCQLTGRPIFPPLPPVDPFIVIIAVFFLLLIALFAGTQIVASRSPHVTYRAEQMDITLDDVIGIDPVKEDVIRSIEVFQSHRQFADQMGGAPRRGLLFEGPPGTGKTMTAKAMAATAGVPFLFVSATSFQSMYYGATAKKIRAYFKALRKAAYAEGGAIGFIEEIDAIAMRRGGLLGSMSSVVTPSGAGHLPGLPTGGLVRNAVISEGTGGVVNELLVQMQSFDEPTGLAKFAGKIAARINLLLPPHRQIQQARPKRAPVLLIAATNRGDNLDPALLRPGRFDRRLTFDAPDVHGRRKLVDHFLAKRAHGPELDGPQLRDRLAAATNGWTPVMIEHLLDEALVNSLRRGSLEMSYDDIEKARITEMVGIGQPVTYTTHEQELIATHEAGHATVAWLVAPNRQLEVLTIVKRGPALGLLAHGDCDEVYTRTRYDLRALVLISMGGWVAEELFFGQTTTGPASDLAAATRVAAQMVGAAGMTGSLVSFMATDKDLVSGVLADAKAREQLETVLDEARSAVRGMLSRNRHLVEALRDALMERHELIGDQITEVLERAALSGSPAVTASSSSGMTHPERRTGARRQVTGAR